MTSLLRIMEKVKSIQEVSEGLRELLSIHWLLTL